MDRISASKTPGAKRAHDERGAAFVEFALILPLFMTLVIGVLTGGLAYNRKLDITHASREGSRYGAALDPKTPASTFTAGSCHSSSGVAATQTWAAAVANTAVARSQGDLDCSQVCVALVTGPPGSEALVSGAATDVSTSGAKCYSDPTGTDDGNRVQVLVDRGTGKDKIEAIFYSVPVHLQSRATAKSET
ncbi:MAG: pilus assembly protein [Acidimicrobiales bacterium]|nr:pilus assembly protein [Acidimicrobiales bacterium]